MRKLSFFFIIFVLSACEPAATPIAAPIPQGPRSLSVEENPFAPKPTDANLEKGGVVLNSINLAMDSANQHAIVLFNGSMPTPCHDLRIEVKPPSLQAEVFIKVYSLLRKSIICDSVLRQFDAKIVLGIYSPGVYSVWVNGQPVGDFVSY